MEIIKIESEFDKLSLEAIVASSDNPKAIVQIVHGMAEHKERYLDFINFLVENNFAVIIHDHRGHGKSVDKENHLGHFYTNDIDGIVSDMYTVTKYIKNRFNNLPLYIFSHSMGTLVTRCYLQKHDNEVEKVILCGPPTKNCLVNFGIFLSKLRLKNNFKPDNYLDKLTFSSFSKGYKLPYEWICKNEETVKEYMNDPLCGFIFTSNGFLNLYKLQKTAFLKKKFEVNNKNLKLFVIAGEYDPVIINKKKFNRLVKFLNKVGYNEIESKLYPELRHELLNEKEHLDIYKDVLNFLND